jgi:hypothetical protein
MKNRILSLGLVPAFVRGVVSAALLIGCGGSEPTNETTPTDASFDTAGNQSSSDAGAASDTSRPDSGFDIVAALPDGALRDCAVCIRDQCGTLLSDCFNDSVCSQGVTCTVATCFPRAGGAMGDGGLDLACVGMCFMGNIPAAASAVGGVMCVSMTCGPTCGLMADAGSGGNMADAGSNMADAGSDAADAGSNVADAGSE